MGDQPAHLLDRLAGQPGLHRRRPPGPRAGGGPDPHRKDCGLGRFPSHDFGINSAWLAAAGIAATLLAWLRHLALDADLAKAEPKAALPHPARHGPMARSGRHRRLRIAATWPWANAIVIAWARITALPQAP